MPAMAVVIPVVISSIKKKKNVKVCTEDLHSIKTGRKKQSKDAQQNGSTLLPPAEKRFWRLWKVLAYDQNYKPKIIFFFIVHRLNKIDLAHQLVCCFSASRQIYTVSPCFHCACEANLGNKHFPKCLPFKC